MSKFDLIYEKAIRCLAEQKFFESTFEDNAKALFSMLKEKDLLDKDRTVDYYVSELRKQESNTKKIIIGTEDDSVPTLQLELNQEGNNPNTFSVTLTNLSSPSDSVETFDNDWLETIFKNVAERIKRYSLENIAPEANVEQLPTDSTPQAQPGAEQSELPQ